MLDKNIANQYYSLISMAGGMNLLDAKQDNDTPLMEYLAYANECAPDVPLSSQLVTYFARHSLATLMDGVMDDDTATDVATCIEQHISMSSEMCNVMEEGSPCEPSLSDEDVAKCASELSYYLTAYYAFVHLRGSAEDRMAKLFENESSPYHGFLSSAFMYTAGWQTFMAGVFNEQFEGHTINDDACWTNGCTIAKDVDPDNYIEVEMSSPIAYCDVQVNLSLTCAVLGLACYDKDGRLTNTACGCVRTDYVQSNESKLYYNLVAGNIGVNFALMCEGQPLCLALAGASSTVTCNFNIGLFGGLPVCTVVAAVNDEPEKVAQLSNDAPTMMLEFAH